MWRYYNKDDTGYSIGIERKYLDKYTNHYRSELSKGSINTLKKYEVYYKNQETIKKEIKEKILFSIQNNRQHGENLPGSILLDWWQNRFSIKHECFKSEEEIRYVIEVPYTTEDLPGSKTYQVKYRAGNGLIIPYIEIELPKEAVKTITVSPTAPEMTLHSVNKFIDGIYGESSNIKVKRSELPIRF